MGYRHESCICGSSQNGVVLRWPVHHFELDLFLPEVFCRPELNVECYLSQGVIWLFRRDPVKTRICRGEVAQRDIHFRQCVSEDEVDAASSIYKDSRDFISCDLCWNNQRRMAWPRYLLRVVSSVEPYGLIRPIQVLNCRGGASTAILTCLVINFCTLFVGLAFWIIYNAPFDWVYPPLGLLGPVICRMFCWLPFVSAGGGGGGRRCTSLRGPFTNPRFTAST